MTPDQHERAMIAANVAAFLPIIEEEIGRMKQGIQNRVSKKIKAGEMTPEYADSAWRDMNSLDRLLQRIKTHVMLGDDVAEGEDDGTA
jgi:hypothetical protein